MKNTLLYLLLLFLLSSCTQKEEIFIVENNQLLLRWNTTIIENSAIVYLFETEHDYLKHIVKPGYEVYSRNVNMAQRNIDYNREASFTGIQPYNYYILSINNPVNTSLIEHNLNYPAQLKEPLVDFAKTTLRLNVSRHSLNRTRIRKLKYLNFPYNLDLEIGNSYTYTLYKIKKSNKDTSIIERQNLIIEESNFLEISPNHSEELNLSQNHYEKYVIGIASNTGKEHFTPINYLNLLKGKMYFDDNLSLYDSSNEPILSMEVNWN